MQIDIRTTPLVLTIFGFGGSAVNKDYTQLAFQLSGRMWETVKNNNLKNKGKNIWVYDINDTVFAGVEAEENTDLASFGLDKKIITLNKYAYCVHKGSYQLIKETGNLMRHELSKQGSVITFPYIEIYGHWNADESRLETELLMCLE